MSTTQPSPSTEARMLVTKHRETVRFEMCRAEWEAFDWLLAKGKSAARLTAIAVQEHRLNPALSRSEWLANVVNRFCEAVREREYVLAELSRFCASQPRTEEGNRAIEAEAKRLKVSSNVLWPVTQKRT